jgi:NAD(P)H-dependent FMN reductase
LRAQEHLRGSACFLNLHVLNFPIFQVRLFDAPHPVDFTTGDVIDDKVKEQAAAVTAALADWARRLVK